MYKTSTVRCCRCCEEFTIGAGLLHRLRNLRVPVRCRRCRRKARAFAEHAVRAHFLFLRMRAEQKL